MAWARGGGRCAELDMGNSVLSPGDRSTGVGGAAGMGAAGLRLDAPTPPSARGPRPREPRLFPALWPGSRRGPTLARSGPPCSAPPRPLPPAQASGLSHRPSPPRPASLTLRPAGGRVWAEGSSDGEFEHLGGSGQKCGRSQCPVSWLSDDMRPRLGNLGPRHPETEWHLAGEQDMGPAPPQSVHEPSNPSL